MKKLTINKMAEITTKLYPPFSEEIGALLKKLSDEIREELDSLNMKANNKENKDVIFSSIISTVIIHLGELLDIRYEMPQHDSLKRICKELSSENQSIH
ncbi:hypothetical protein UFOVP899_58 [uncultured Caudovirales phage]|uniref:Uncharacterized protein n=1 Tax=uncultured Caudovirales phage TaxID=2100421 RepID=A0A6J5Q5D6_9CAUD|nr:hypothetical protein UFOVP899_58 [uncultured Caudovirales phage]CAB4176758.1 hypothetical protein UFOVP987_57 [uncultured Caudovirales phage]CAB4181233.1 hypothetical protein UFOVP1074_46 [uncultured Caudovirales phage]CAB4198034.1 hypothetical protein UFOVP1310_35 [uncultured Caudovirales phage]CAB4210681.1 hypothetical protein UFOVP1424_37 [uncultured Caudovirales phage]